MILHAQCTTQHAEESRLHASRFLHFELCILTCVVAFLVSATFAGAAQVGGKLVVGGNPTPGTEQPEAPNLADRITLTGCLQAAGDRAVALAKAEPTAPIDANTPSDTRFVLANAERIHRVPAGTVLTMAVPGGGGFGNPFRRDPDKVAADVQAGLVTLEGARRSYGVAIASDGTVDRSATAALRGSHGA